MFVEVDADKHTENAQDVDFNAEPEYEFDQHQVDRQRRVDTGRKMSGKNTLDGSLRRHDVQDLAEYPAKQSSDQHKDEQNPWRFPHDAPLLP